MTSAMHWLRARQGTHTKAILVAFVLAWFQAAVVPCAMAHAPIVESPEPRPMQHGGHDCHGTTGKTLVDHDSSGHAPVHCPYCPPAAGGGNRDCDHAAGCVYPHDPRIDARTLSPLLGPPPCQMPGAIAKPESISSRVAAGDVQVDFQRRPLSVSYCRYLE